MIKELNWSQIWCDVTLWINPADNPDQHIRSNYCCLIKTQKPLRTYQRDNMRKHSWTVQFTLAPINVSVGLEHESERWSSCWYFVLSFGSESRQSFVLFGRLKINSEVYQQVNEDAADGQTLPSFCSSFSLLMWIHSFIHSFTQGSEGESPADPVEHASFWKIHKTFELNWVQFDVTCKFISWSSFIMKQTSCPTGWNSFMFLIVMMHFIWSWISLLIRNKLVYCQLV